MVEDIGAQRLERALGEQERLTKSYEILEPAPDRLSPTRGSSAACLRDHLGALPFVVRELGQSNVPAVYGRRLTVGWPSCLMICCVFELGGRACGVLRGAALKGGR